MKKSKIICNKPVISCLLNGDIAASQAVRNASNEKLENGEKLTFYFVPEDMDITIDMENDKVSLSIGVYGPGEDMTDRIAALGVDLDADDEQYYDGSFYRRSFTITGSAEKGYEAE